MSPHLECRPGALDRNLTEIGHVRLWQQGREAIRRESAHLGKSCSRSVYRGNESRVVDGDRVWANAHKLAVFLMRLLKDQVGAFGLDPVNPLEVREFCKEWPGNVTETPPCPPKLQDHKQYHRSGSKQRGTTNQS